MELSSRQIEIVELVKRQAPITGDQIAEYLGVSKPTIRSDLAVLVMLKYIDAKPKVGYFPGEILISEGQLAPRIHEMKVKDIQGQPIAVRETATVGDAVITLFLENVGSLVVTNEEGMLAGIVSRKDLLKVTLGNAEASKMPVSFVMTREPNVVTIGENESVLEAARKMIRHQVDSLPVVRNAAASEKGGQPPEIVGRVTKTHMTQILLELSSSM